MPKIYHFYYFMRDKIVLGIYIYQVMCMGCSIQNTYTNCFLVFLCDVLFRRHLTPNNFCLQLCGKIYSDTLYLSQKICKNPVVLNWWMSRATTTPPDYLRIITYILKKRDLIFELKNTYLQCNTIIVFLQWLSRRSTNMQMLEFQLLSNACDRVIRGKCNC